LLIGLAMKMVLSIPWCDCKSSLHTCNVFVSKRLFSFARYRRLRCKWRIDVFKSNKVSHVKL